MVPPGAYQKALGQDPGAGHMLGLSVVAVGAGTAVGANYGGMYGAIAGALFGGAIMNGVRAYQNFRLGTPEGAHEAKVSGAWTLLALGVGIYFAAKAEADESLVGLGAARNPEEEEEEEDPEEVEDEPSRVLPTGTPEDPKRLADVTPCAVRKVGP